LIIRLTSYLWVLNIQKNKLRIQAGIVAIVMVLVSFQAFAKRDSVPYITFQLLDATTQSPIGLAHVISSASKVGTISDPLGYFRIPLGLNDTLRISAIGYYDMRVPSWGQFSPDSLYYPIHLTSRIYQIKEVRITRFGSYERFLLEAAKMELPKSDQELVQERLEEYFRKTITQLDLKNLPQHTSGAIFGKDWFAIQREKIEEKSREERKWDIIYRKFSASVVIQLTGLNEMEAIRFMVYCDFTEAFILTASEYEVRKRILDKFAEYKILNRINSAINHDNGTS